LPAAHHVKLLVFECIWRYSLWYGY
jgi:hypothetical protein